MSEKIDENERCREAEKAALERAFVHGDPQDNVAQARGIVAYLGAAKYSDDEAPDKDAMYGYRLVLKLLDILLEQAERRVE